jgi:hypothetical protein
MANNEVNLDRRKFLLVAGCAPAAGVAAVLGLSPETGAATLGAAPLDPPAISGYHETEHIRKYYYSARYF